MSQRSQEIQVGLAVIVALVVLIVGLLWFQRVQFNQSHTEIRVKFPAVGGLAGGDPVHVRGIPMGKVTQVSLADGGTVVDLKIDEQVKLTMDATFAIEALGFVGEFFVATEPGKGAPVPDGHMFEGELAPTIGDAMAQMKSLGDQAGELITGMTQLLADVQAAGGLGPTVEQSAKAARLAAEVLQENSVNFARASKSMANLSENVDEFFEKHGESMGKGIDGMASMTGRADSLITRLNTLTEGANDIVTALREQRGTAGKMIYDEAMAENVASSIETMKFLLDDLLRNPQRYLTVKIF